MQDIVRGTQASHNVFGCILKVKARSHINRKGVQKHLKYLNPHKATGPDEVPSRILHIGTKALSPSLVSFYQYSIDTGEVPQEWREVNVVPIFKKGDRHQPHNYCPVSLASVVCKGT